MKILVINGNPKKQGFTAGMLEILRSRLADKGAEVETLQLADVRIEDCTGCFQCLQKGTCYLEDDMNAIIEKMRAADGLVIGSPVRNGSCTACYKRFLERITYLLGFAMHLDDTYVLAISSVGVGGGKRANKQLLGLKQPFRARLSNYLFFRVGLPAKKQPEDVRGKLERAADKLLRDIRSKRPRPLFGRVAFRLDRLLMRKLFFEKNPDRFRYIVKCWQEKGYM